MSTARHPQDVLFEDGDTTTELPVCDHYCGVEARMRKSLELQGELGPVFDVTLDGEDGAPVGGEVEHAHLIAELASSSANRHGRVGARIVPVSHPAFIPMLEVLVRRAGDHLAYLTVPKPRHLADVRDAIAAIDRMSTSAGVARPIPVQALVETHGALRDAAAIAALPRIEALSFGLMDFVSAHRGAIPQSAMTAEGQFQHPLVVRAKLEMAAACHAAGKVASHCVVTEFKDQALLGNAARRAALDLGYQRMWSIHPDQIRVIVDAFKPQASEVATAADILLAAQATDWAPIRHRHDGQDRLHDRASYRYYWHVLKRARATAVAGEQAIPPAAWAAFFEATD